MMSERLVWREVFLLITEQLFLLLLLLLPRAILVRKLQALVAQEVYTCSRESITLYKSGRAALHGVLETLHACDPRRTVVLVPDYICNVVVRACCAAGFRVTTYSTTESCVPEWAELERMVRATEAPVVLLCSLFGSIPVKDEQVKELLSINEEVIIVADECQNLIPHSGVEKTRAHVIIFSFNDKTCPGVMGGGAVWSHGTFGKPFVEKVSFVMQWKCRAGLYALWLSRVVADAVHISQVAVKKSMWYARPTRYEFSECQRAHYDLRAEGIYALSAARAILSVRALGRYRDLRATNVNNIQKVLSKESFVNVSVAKMHAPPFLPVMPIFFDAYPCNIPFPLKAPYASPDDPNKAIRPFYSIKLTTPFVRFVG